jgi:hypothetical protein
MTMEKPPHPRAERTGMVLRDVSAGAGILVLLAFLTACGENGNGEEDTLLTGLSGVVIVVLVAWFLVRAVKKRR